MNNVYAIALSGLKASQTQLAVSAHNLANLATEGFQAQKVNLSANATGGVSAQVEQTQQGVDLVNELITSQQAKFTYVANVAVIQIQKEMDESLLGIFIDRRA